VPEIKGRADQNIPNVVKALEQAIARASGSTDFQAQQAIQRWKLVKAGLKEYVLPASDFGGKPIPSNPALGCVQ
jgi:hypothetical protein